MDRAHRQDYADKRRLDDLRQKIEEFLEEPPSRASLDACACLQSAHDALQASSDRVVRVWD